MQTQMIDVAHNAVTSSDVIVAVGIFLFTYALILSERINRAIIATMGAGLMIMSGVITQDQAIGAVDFNTLGLLLGMMMIVTVTKESGVFQYVAILTSKLVKASPLGILAMISVVTAVFSAILDNVTTVLLMTPVLLLITRELNVKPYPYLFTSILSANIGGTATLIGDPPNIMIGSAANLTFLDFIVHLTPLALIVMPLTLLPLLFMYRKSLVASDENRARIMNMSATAAIEDWHLLYKSLGVLVLVIIGFIVGHTYFHIPPATFALSGAALLLLLDNIKLNAEKQHEKVHHAIAEAEWITLFFFFGLFVVVFGIEHVGVIAWMAEHMMDFTGGDLAITAMALLWGGAIISTIVDNIPFVATMIPMLKDMLPAFGDNGETLWWALAAGACLGGNGSLIGSSANLVVAGLAEKGGHPIRFLPFMAMAFPFMIWSIVIASGYFYLFYL